ncbi:MAG: ComEA family DNA-binding protein [Chloroflexi bacterium]|nr:ComEA family DNA-binding protein [Chloroflexota bacterium]
MNLAGRYRLVLILILVALILAGGGLLLYRQTTISGSGGIIISPPSTEIRVYVEGEVVNPGVYELNGEALIADAVAAAGGFSAEADRASVNLAATLRDGGHIHVCRVGEIPQKVNINTAELWLLEALPGIGEVLAQRIIDYRTANGQFQEIDELMRVEGMGPKVFELIKDKITVR